MKMKQGVFFLTGLAIAAIFGSAGLMPRVVAERANSVAAIVTDMRDVSNMARESGVPVLEALDELRSRGLTGVAVGELTGQELLSGVLPVEYGSAGNLLHGDIPEGVLPDSAVILLNPGNPYTGDIELFAAKKYPGSRIMSYRGARLVVLPFYLGETLEAGILPDYPLFAMLDGTDVPIIYRPGSTPGVRGEEVAASLALVLDSWPEIRSVVPAGFFVAGYPELGPAGSLLKERGHFYSQGRVLPADRNRVPGEGPFSEGDLPSQRAQGGDPEQGAHQG